MSQNVLNLRQLESSFKRVSSKLKDLISFAFANSFKATTLHAIESRPNFNLLSMYDGFSAASLVIVYFQRIEGLVVIELTFGCSRVLGDKGRFEFHTIVWFYEVPRSQIFETMVERVLANSIFPRGKFTVVRHASYE